MKRVKERNPVSEASQSVETMVSEYKLAYLSRRVSLTGRREVLNGRAKFGAFGAGKELAQLAIASVFKHGDWRSGYYRDQTFALATDMVTIQGVFSQLYGNTTLSAEPSHGGRSMPSHYATRLLDEAGNWLPQTDRHNSTSDISPTSGQMPRLVGLAYASRLYRELDELKHLTQFSQRGNEVAFGTIGNGSVGEGAFWESINAIGVLKSPAVLSIFDDGYAISVRNEHHFIHKNLSQQLEGFRYDEESGRGYNLYTVRGWDYPALLSAYRDAAEAARKDHIPAIIHVTEMTQPQGHSTSGSHERYKSAERLAWEAEYDPVKKMRDWMLAEEIASETELKQIEDAANTLVESERLIAWQAYAGMHGAETAELIERLEAFADSAEINLLIGKLRNDKQIRRRQRLEIAQRALIVTRHTASIARQQLLDWAKAYRASHHKTYGSHLHSQSESSPRLVRQNAPQYDATPKAARGFEVLRENFNALLKRDPRIIIFGEDVGFLGDVNQGLAGMQAEYGVLRVSDTGIRETTIIGQAIGMALRGLRPIAEIQYLDYILYAMNVLSDDLATTRWRTAGGQAAPVIVRTRGHRLEGIWHSGSPMAALINLLRGMHICVPRNMTQAAGFYNTLLQGDDPALVVESLNGYRLHESMPTNLAEFTVPLGMVETLREGGDVTVVTYGSSCRIAMEAAAQLSELGISAEIIDVQTLLPFDLSSDIAKSVAKTNRLVIFDEDMPGGTSAYILQQVLEQQNAYWSLDSEPHTIHAQPHRPAFTTDGDYFSKPSVENVVTEIYNLMHESNPGAYPAIF